MNKSALNNSITRSKELDDILSGKPDWMTRWGTFVFSFVIALIIMVALLKPYRITIEDKVVVLGIDHVTFDKGDGLTISFLWRDADAWKISNGQQVLISATNNRYGPIESFKGKITFLSPKKGSGNNDFMIKVTFLPPVARVAGKYFTSGTPANVKIFIREESLRERIFTSQKKSIL